jgi:glycosyltransferase involved in cell wall biosynthesis
LSNEVTIVGEVAELATLIESVDVVIVPSVQPEPFGLIAIEAFALSRPVIASDAGGLAQIVHNDYNGLKFKSGEQHSLVDALERIRKMDVSQLGGNARATYDAKYSTSRFEAALQLAWPTPQVRSPARSGRRIENEDRK